MASGPRGRSSLVLRVLFTASLGIGAVVFFRANQAEAAPTDYSLAIASSQPSPVRPVTTYNHFFTITDGASAATASGYLTVNIVFVQTGADRAQIGVDYDLGDATDADWECSLLVDYVVSCQSRFERAPESFVPPITVPVIVSPTAVDGRVIRVTANVNTPALTGSPDSNDAVQDITINAPDLTLLSEPCRIYQSATAAGGLAGVLDGGESLTIQVTGALSGQGASTNCVPSGATSVIVSIAAVEPQAAGNLRLVAAGGVAGGGVVNYAPNGLDNSNTVTASLSEGGAVDVSANGGVAGAGLPSTNVRLSVLGYYGSGSLTFFPVTPCTVADSRANQGASGGFAGPFGSGGAYPDVDVVGTFSAAQGGGNTICGVPTDADGVVVNLVAVNAAGGVVICRSVRVVPSRRSRTRRSHPSR